MAMGGAALAGANPEISTISRLADAAFASTSCKNSLSNRAGRPFAISKAHSSHHAAILQVPQRNKLSLAEPYSSSRPSSSSPLLPSTQQTWRARARKLSGPGRGRTVSQASNNESADLYITSGGAAALTLNGDFSQYTSTASPSSPSTSTAAKATKDATPCANGNPCSSDSDSEACQVFTVESMIESFFVNTRFFSLFATAGSLVGSVLCFLRGCVYVKDAVFEFFHSCKHNANANEVIFLLVEAVDVYLMGTVLLILGLGVFELFVGEIKAGPNQVTSSLFGLFRFQERPKWLQITSLEDLKSKLGHVIVMILLVGLFSKAKYIAIKTSVDLLLFSVAILVCSGALWLLAQLNSHG